MHNRHQMSKAFRSIPRSFFQPASVRVGHWPRNLALGIGILVAAPVTAGDATSRAAVASRYDPLETFAPLTLSPQPSRYRSAGGIPGPDYWQNRADYEIHAWLKPETKQLVGNEVITYTNDSPDSLKSLWLQLDQNTYRREARSVAADAEAHAPAPRHSRLVWYRLRSRTAPRFRGHRGRRVAVSAP